LSSRDRNSVPGQRIRQEHGLLIWLSGADVSSLALTPRETRKFVGLGGIVLTTAALAGVSATFALTMGARVPVWGAVPAGLLWGLAIMNLDRWLVTATQRRPKAYQNVLAAVPRVLMALIVGAVISTPLVLWLFQQEIDAQLNVIHQRRLDQHQQKLLNDTRFKGIPDLQARIATNQAIADGTASGAATDPAVADLQSQFNELDKKFQAAQASATCEFDGTCGTGTRGGGEAYRQKQAVADDLKRQRDEVGARLEQARKDADAKRQQTASAERGTAAAQVTRDRAELDRLQRLKQAEEDQFKADTANDDGLLARLGALSELTGSNGTLRTAYIMLLLFITTIEVLPIVVKFLMNLAPPTTYDRVMEQSDEVDVAKATAELERRKHLARFEAEARTAREEQLIRERTGRLTSTEDYDDAPAPHFGSEPVATRVMTWLRMRRPASGPVGYSPWPDSEPNRTVNRSGEAVRGGGSRTAPIDEEPLSEKWSFDK
jgi:hypothetical protein